MIGTRPIASEIARDAVVDVAEGRAHGRWRDPEDVLDRLARPPELCDDLLVREVGKSLLKMTECHHFRSE